MSRSTLAMVAVFALVAAGVWALQTTQPPPREGAPTYVLEVSEAEVQHLGLTTGQGPAAFDRLEPFGWKFTDSGQQADFGRVNSVVNRVAKLRSQAKVLDRVSDLALYGLDPPAITAVLTMKDGTIHRVLVGSKTPNEAAYYATVEAKGALHTINTLIVGDMEKLVTDPPVPTPTPEGTPPPTPTPTATPTGTVAPTATATPTATVGLPAPSVQ